MSASNKPRIMEMDGSSGEVIRSGDQLLYLGYRDGKPTYNK